MEHDRLTGNLSPNCASKKTLQGYPLKQSFSQNKTQSLYIFLCIVRIDISIPYKFVGSFLCFALFEEAYFLRKDRTHHKMHPLPEQTPRIFHHLIVKLNF